MDRRRVLGYKSSPALKIPTAVPAAIVLALALLFSGCVFSEPKPVSEAKLSAPEAYRSASTGNQGKISTGWVSTFRDRDLKRLVDEALKHNLDLQEASATLEAANQTRKGARAQRRPQIGFSGNTSRTRRGDGFREDGGDELVVDTNNNSVSSLTSVDFGLSLDASWELDLWGRLRDLDEAAGQDYLSALADFRSARLSLAANTAQAYFGLITARQQLDLAEKTLISFESNLRITERNYKSGDDTASALDVQFGRNNVASAERSLVSQRLARDEAARTLEILLGRYPSAELKAGDKLPTLSKEVPAGLPAELLWRRPDLVAAAADLKASARRATAARKELLPSISLTGRASTASDALNSVLADPQFIVWNAAASLAQTVYAGGQPSADVRRALADNEAALRRFASLTLGAFREVESALATERSLAEQERYLDVELRQAELAEKQSAREYSDGIVGILEILEAQRRAVAARNSMITLRNQRLQNRVDLFLALGGDFSTSSP